MPQSLGWDDEESWERARDNARALQSEYSSLSASQQAACELLEISEECWDDMEPPAAEAEQAAAAKPAAGGGVDKPAPALRRVARQHEAAALMAMRAALVEEVASFFVLDGAAAKSLLSHYEWDISRVRGEVAARWFEGERAAVLREVGEVEGGVAEADMLEADMLECGVCMSEFESRGASGPKNPSRVRPARCSLNATAQAWVTLSLRQEHVKKERPVSHDRGEKKRRLVLKSV